VKFSFKLRAVERTREKPFVHGVAASHAAVLMAPRMMSLAIS